MDRQAFHRFYQETASALRAYLRLRCRSSSLADDLVQETYLRMLRQELPDLDAAQRRAYLYKAAHSVLADHYRARRRETQWNVEHAGQRGGAQGEIDDALELAAWTLLDPLELPFDMQVILDSLKPKQKTLLWLAYVEGFTHHEIADVVGVNASSVRVLLSRARAELAGKLDDERVAYRAVGERAR